MCIEQNDDGRMKAALEKGCEGISASEELKRRIDETIRRKQEGNSMKHTSVKKFCISAASACLLVSGITVWAGARAFFVAGSSIEPEYTNYAMLEEAEKELGYEVDSVERFDNGFTFYGMSVENMQACTEEGDRMYSIPSMNIRYLRGDQEIDLNVNETVSDMASAKEPKAVRMCGDIELRYDEYTNKLVPASYELTEEDKINEQRDDYNIVYTTIAVNGDTQITGETDDADGEEVKHGTYAVSEDGSVVSTVKSFAGQDGNSLSVTYDEVSIHQSMLVRWEKDGKTYELTCTDLTMSADELFDMAEEILEAR